MTGLAATNKKEGAQLFDRVDGDFLGPWPLLPLLGFCEAVVLSHEPCRERNAMLILGLTGSSDAKPQRQKFPFLSASP